MICPPWDLVEFLRHEATYVLSVCCERRYSATAEGSSDASILRATAHLSQRIEPSTVTIRFSLADRPVPEKPGRCEPLGCVDHVGAGRPSRNGSRFSQGNRQASNQG